MKVRSSGSRFAARLTLHACDIAACFNEAMVFSAKASSSGQEHDALLLISIGSKNFPRCATQNLRMCGTVRAPFCSGVMRETVLVVDDEPLARMDIAQTLAEFELALRLNPNFSLAQGYYGLALSYSGRWQDGGVAARRALRLSPRDPFSAIYYGIDAYAQFIGRNYDEAMRLSRGRPSGNAAISSAPIGF